MQNPARPAADATPAPTADPATPAPAPAPAAVAIEAMIADPEDRAVADPADARRIAASFGWTIDGPPTDDEAGMWIVEIPAAAAAEFERVGYARWTSNEGIIEAEMP